MKKINSNLDTNIPTKSNVSETVERPPLTEADLIIYLAMITFTNSIGSASATDLRFVEAYSESEATEIIRVNCTTTLASMGIKVADIKLIDIQNALLLTYKYFNYEKENIKTRRR